MMHLFPVYADISEDARKELHEKVRVFREHMNVDGISELEVAVDRASDGRITVSPLKQGVDLSLSLHLDLLPPNAARSSVIKRLAPRSGYIDVDLFYTKDKQGQEALFRIFYKQQ